MVAQHHRNHDYVNPVDYTERESELPRITDARKYSRQKEEDKEDRFGSNPRHLWVVFSWGVILVNITFAAPIVWRNMWVMSYDFTSHYSVIVAFIGSFAAIAAIYKFIINRDEDV